MSMDSLRTKARILMWLVTVPFVLLALLGGIQFWFVLSGPKPPLLILLMFAPMYVYIGAIWMVRQALSAISRGAMFDQVVPKLLFRVGIALFFGALFNVFASPAISIMFKLRIGVFFDGAAVTLGVIGATLILLSHLLKQAASMREELDSFF
jgi:hypothetical protein